VEDRGRLARLRRATHRGVLGTAQLVARTASRLAEAREADVAVLRVTRLADTCGTIRHAARSTGLGHDLARLAVGALARDEQLAGLERHADRHLVRRLLQLLHVAE